MAIEHGKIEGDLVVDSNLTLHGMVTGSITVVNGGFLALHGMCCHNLVVERGARVELHGTVSGNVLNRGGQLDVHGTVAGHVHTERDGDTSIAPNAVVRGGTSYDREDPDED